MDLYDDLDTKQRAGQIDGWSSGIKMLQTQLAIKKAAIPQPKKEPPKKPMLTPIISLRPKKQPIEEDIFHQSQVKNESRPQKPTKTTIAQPLAPVIENSKIADYDWDFADEYDPFWPNEYEKLVKKHEKEKDSRREDRSERNDRKRRNNNRSDSPTIKFSGFSGRQTEEDTETRSPPSSGAGNTSKAGAAIAPPPSLQEITINNSNGDGSSSVTIPYSASSVAAKIMAKYGFKDGQGLGKQEQGMSMALQVEKTSKRGGRIIHEKELFMPPSTVSSPTSMLPPTNAPSPNITRSASPQPPPIPATTNTAETDKQPKSEPSITEIMKEPSKVVLLRNMVGPGDVDTELEPEVKDECNTKYGDVISVLIHEAFGTSPEDAVRIFVEFKRIESAIKAVVDLNGRFFGGRQVRAGFYNYDKFKGLQLN